MDKINLSEEEFMILFIGAVVIAIIISAMLSKKSKPAPEPTFTDAMQRVRERVLLLLELPKSHHPPCDEQFKTLFEEYQKLKKMRERAQNTWSQNGEQPDEN